jgi:archaellum component FlaC
MTVMERDRWTDERIDERFDRVDADIRGLRTGMKEGFEQISKRFDQVDKRFERVDDKFDAVQRNMTTWAIALLSTIVSLNVAVIAAIALT